jgi:hypothetical protein
MTRRARASYRPPPANAPWALPGRIYVAHYNLCRVHESLRSTPAMTLGIADRIWTIGDLLDAALATQPITPVTIAPDRRKSFRVIDGGKS